MEFLKNIFASKPIRTNLDFWEWFRKHERKFLEVVRRGKHIERDFFDKLSPKLLEVKDGYYFLTGMYDDRTAELILTADGMIRNFVFVEQLVSDAPSIEGWKITAHKPALAIEDVGITMGNYKFTSSNLNFYPNDLPSYPDEIDITVVHDELTDKNEQELINGTYIFLDNFLGELNFATTIDNLRIIGKEKAEKELIPIKKLKDYLIWREKEFIEKYDGIRHIADDDSCSIFKATLENGNPLVAVINMDLLNWDRKPSHPWMLRVTIQFGLPDVNNGMPDDARLSELDGIGEDILKKLKDTDGYLYVGRQTAEGIRDIYFACRDFRKPSLVIHELALRYHAKFDITYDIYKDKYWQCFNRFTDD